MISRLKFKLLKNRKVKSQVSGIDLIISNWLEILNTVTCPSKICLFGKKKFKNVLGNCLYLRQFTSNTRINKFVSKPVENNYPFFRLEILKKGDNHYQLFCYISVILLFASDCFESRQQRPNSLVCKLCWSVLDRTPLREIQY